MKDTEKEILKTIVNHTSGLLYPAILPEIAKKNRSEFQKLISKKYIEEVHETIPSGKVITCYRTTSKGHGMFDPFYIKFWDAIKGDVRNVLVSIVISLITTLITLFITRKVN